MSPSAWFITGCFSGFGATLAEELLVRNVPVVVSARKLDSLQPLFDKGAKGVQWDVDNDEVTLKQKADEVDELVEGGIAVVVNNAGFAAFGSAEEQDYDAFRSILETNFFGLVKTTRAFLPLLRSRNTGTIVNISSIAGIAGGASYSAYSAAKHAVDGFTLSLAQEVSHLNIRTLLVNPGYFRTNFLSSSAPQVVGPISAYKPITQPVQDALGAYAGQQPGDPILGARAIVDTVLGSGPAAGKEWTGRLLLGPDAVEVMEGIISAEKRGLEVWRG
ncbi:hypothetical protein JCM8097_008067 [Rhodosporidiobolus ruineniae]